MNVMLGLIANIENEWDTVWEVFPELSNNSREPAKIPLTSPSLPAQAPPPLISALPCNPFHHLPH